MFYVDEEILSHIKNLDDDIDFMAFRTWLDTLADDRIASTIHSWPDATDAAYSARIDIQRGIAAALDTLRNIIADPGKLIQEYKENKKRIETMQLAMSESDSV